MSNFYSGSKIFQPVSDVMGLSVDQFNFIVCQLAACGFGYVFSRHLNTDRISPTLRHIIQLISGVSLTIFCFGSQIWHLLAQAVSVYIMMNAMNTKSARYFILGFVLLFLSVAHMARMYYDYGGYTMDITGVPQEVFSKRLAEQSKLYFLMRMSPLMIQTQKLSSLAFNLHDGQRIKKNEPLRREYHRKHALLKYPTLLEFFSYMFYFHGIMVGPFVFMADYLRFIEGRQDEVLEDKQQIEYYKKNKESILAGRSEILRYFRFCVVFGLITIFIQPHYDAEILKSDEFLQSSMFYKYFILTVVAFLIRQKYYFAWSIGSMSNIYSGLGFSGFNKDMTPQYDVVQNFDFFKIELGSSTKTIIDGWNTGTIFWLRECVYDRTPRSYNTLSVFICSAIWHGYYPGYYICFLSLALFTTAGRRARKYIRPLFHKASLHLVYDVLTALGGMFALNYASVSFTMLEINQTVYIWSKMYFVVHVGCVLLYFLSPLLSSGKPDSGSSSSHAESDSTRPDSRRETLSINCDEKID